MRNKDGADTDRLIVSNCLSSLTVAEDKFSETTIGYRPGDLATAERFLKVFDTPTFRVGLVEDVAGVSLCGALKNVVAIAAGFTDGLGWGSNAKGEFRAAKP